MSMSMDKLKRKLKTGNDTSQYTVPRKNKSSTPMYYPTHKFGIQKGVVHQKYRHLMAVKNKNLERDAAILNNAIKNNTSAKINISKKDLSDARNIFDMRKSKKTALTRKKLVTSKPVKSKK